MKLYLVFFVCFYITIANSKDINIPNGDLIFVRPPLDASSSLDSAILASGNATLDWLRSNNYSVDSNNYISTHVALSYHAADGSRYFIQAVPPQGVLITPLEDFLHMIPIGTELFWGQLAWKSADIRNHAINRALKQDHKPYANDFGKPPSEFYCSSLVEYAYESYAPFFNDTFTLIFVPMSFWEPYYEARNLSVPVNMTGSNPTLLMYSPVVALTKL